MNKRSLLLVAVVGALVTGMLPFPDRAASAADPDDYSLTHAYVPSEDGTLLHAWVWRPGHVAADERTPVILQVSPYTAWGNRTQGDEPTVPAHVVKAGVFERGYTYIEAELRGYGASGGCADLGGPGEQADARALVEWAAAQPWSTGRVGMWGGSYNGWTQLMAAAQPPKGLAAVAPAAAPQSLYSFLYTNGVPTAARSVTAPVYLATDVLPPGPPEGTQGVVNIAAASAGHPGCGTDNLAPTLASNDPSTAYYRERDLVPGLRGSSVPMFLTQGFVDLRVRPLFLDFWTTLQGPRHLYVGQWQHSANNEAALGRTGRTAALMDFYDRHVKQVAAPCSAGATVQDGDGRWRVEQAWPPDDAAATAFPVLPGTYVDAGGNQAEADETSVNSNGVDPGRGPAVFPTGNGSWTFTPPFAADAHLAGQATLAVDVTVMRPDVNLVALLYEVAADGQATFVARGAYLLRRSGRVELAFDPQDWRVERGHRLGLLLAGSDLNWYDTANTGTPVTVHDGELSVPFLRMARRAAVDGGPSSYVKARGSFPVDRMLQATRTASAPTPPAQSNGRGWEPRPGRNCNGNG